MSPSESHGAGIRFDNGFQSDGLARILEGAMQHQNSFTLPPNLGRQGLLQITAPTGEERAAAFASLSDAFDRASSVLAEPLLATS
jgi:hypothetical protein